MKKMIKTLALSSALALLAASSVSCTSKTQNFSSTQQKEIQKIVHDYLVNNPEVLIEASQALQAKEMEKAKSQALQGISATKEKIFNDPASPTAGNPNGNVVLVEFFDYQCSHCKEMQPIIEKVLASNNNIKIIYKEFPIFGASSAYAAQMALASVKQNKYAEFHKALFNNPGPLNEAKVDEIAKSLGLDVAQMKKDINDPAIKQQLSSNYDIAKALSLQGTPSFVISNKALTQFDFIPGAAPEDQFQKSLDEIAKKQ